MKASEVLAEALEFWGPEMERWMSGSIGDGTRACLVGGMVHATNGNRDVRVYNTLKENQEAYHEALKYVLDELDAQGWPRDIIEFNDSASARGYGIHGEIWNNEKRTKRIRAIVCAALKRALETEA